MIDLALGDSEAIIAEAKRRGVLRNQLAYILATTRWETAHTMLPVKEAYWLSEQWREDNLRYYPFYGRGYVQLTWAENYAHAQDELDLGTQLTDNPDRALDSSIAKMVLIEGMMDGWFTGARLPQYVDLQQSDFVGARAVVNGTDKASEIAAIAHEYDHALQAAGYGEDDVEPEPVPVNEDRLFLIAIRDQINAYLGDSND